MLEVIVSVVVKNRLSVIAIVLFALSSMLAYHIHTSTDAFARAYRDYAELANVSDLGALVPGAANNPVRMQINDILTQVLADKMSDAQRLDLSKHGLELITYSQNQIDAITPKLDATNASEQKMENSIDFITSLFSKGLPEKIITFARERSAAISDIRAYSYRADFDTQKIFQHIVGNNGALPNSYITELNSEIPAEEQEFNDRQNRYNDLQNLGDAIKQNFADFEGRFASQKSGE